MSMWLRRFSKLVCFSTLFLIFAGGLVTSTGSGLSVPDWPLSYGMLFPPMVGGVFFEHGHRMIASAVGFLTLCFAVWMGFKEPRRWVKILGFCALGAVILQGLLGGLTVLFFLPTPVSVAHGVLAQTFFVLTVILAYSHSAERLRRNDSGETMVDPAFLRMALLLIALVYLQLIVAALMRHTHSGLAIPDFPKTGGRWWPVFDARTLGWINDWRFMENMDPVTMPQVLIHFWHRLGALMITVAATLLTVRGWTTVTAPRIRQSILLLDAAILVQIVLGMATIWTHKEPYVTSLHVVNGAGILGLSVLLLLRSAPTSLEECRTALTRRRSLREPAAQPGQCSLQRQANAGPQKTFRPCWEDYLQMTKPRIASMVLVTTALGYFLAGQGIRSWAELLVLLTGAGLVCSGSAVLNNYLERDVDAKMQRTRNRALPAGRVPPASALAFGIVLILEGVFLLCWQINLMTAFLSLLSAFLYVVVYTPLKRVSWLNTSIGAIPGALPPVGGWAAVHGDVSLGAWLLFAILFIWQHPHFFAIAWMFKDDYRAGGLQMLPVVEPEGNRTFRQVLLFSLALIPVSLTPVMIGLTGSVYQIGALTLGLMVLVSGIHFARNRGLTAARLLLRATVLYLPVLLLFIVLDKALIV